MRGGFKSSSVLYARKVVRVAIRGAFDQNHASRELHNRSLCICALLQGSFTVEQVALYFSSNLVDITTFINSPSKFKSSSRCNTQETLRT